MKHISAASMAVVLFTLLSGSSAASTSRSRGRYSNNNGPPAHRSDLVTLIPQQSCYYQRHNKELICNCNSTDTSAYVLLNMKFYVFNAGEEIKSVHLKQCKELLVTLDLRQVDATNFPVHFEAIGKVEIEKIMFEPKYSDRQELQLVFDNVQQLLFKKIFVEDTLKIRASNVKEVRFVKSTFTHVPAGGFQISRARMLDIRDSYFLRVSPKSIVVEKTKDVSVIKNEMTINALDVVFAKDGSHLMISCNRLLGQPVSPECSKMTTTSTTTTTPPPPYLVNQENLREDDNRNGDGTRNRTINDMLPELVGGIIAGFIIILLVIVCFACLIMRKSKRRQEGEFLQAAPIPSPQKQLAPPEEPIAAPEPVAAAVSPVAKNEKEAADAAHESDSLLNVPGGDDTDDDKPKFHSPIWLDEIHKNKIFNKQKSLLSQDGLKGIADGSLQPQQRVEESEGEDNSGEMLERPPTPQPDAAEAAALSPLPGRMTAVDGVSEEEVKESSRTESDEDFERHHPEKVQKVHPPPVEVEGFTPGPGDAQC